MESWTWAIRTYELKVLDSRGWRLQLNSNVEERHPDILLGDLLHQGRVCSPFKAFKSFWDEASALVAHRGSSLVASRTMAVTSLMWGITFLADADINKVAIEWEVGRNFPYLIPRTFGIIKGDQCEGIFKAYQAIRGLLLGAQLTR